MIEFRQMQIGEENEVFDLIYRTFNEFIAPTYSSEGAESFFKYINLESISQFVKESYPTFTIFVAVIEDQIVGVIGFRARDNNCHITCLFVDGKYHRKGIARGLLNNMIDFCKSHDANLSNITVKSSPYAVSAYKGLGFQQLDSEQIQEGIRYTPMRLEI